MSLTPCKFIRMHVLDMTQTELASHLGVTQPMVAKMEKKGGNIPEAHRDTMRGLAKKLKVTLEDAWFDKVPLKRGV